MREADLAWIRCRALAVGMAEQLKEARDADEVIKVLSLTFGLEQVAHAAERAREKADARPRPKRSAEAKRNAKAK